MGSLRWFFCIAARHFIALRHVAVKYILSSNVELHFLSKHFTIWKRMRRQRIFSKRCKCTMKMAIGVGRVVSISLVFFLLLPRTSGFLTLSYFIPVSHSSEMFDSNRLISPKNTFIVIYMPNRSIDSSEGRSRAENKVSVKH